MRNLIFQSVFLIIFLFSVALANLSSTWSKWSDWSACSQSCGSPINSQQTRVRHCVGLVANCLGLLEEKRICAGILPCNVASQWSAWSECSVTCGPNGTQKRTKLLLTESRSCIPVTSHCQNSVIQTFSWYEWSACSISCGLQNGQQTRKRNCNANELGCSDLSMLDRRPCIPTAPVCPQPTGVWGLWSPWGICDQLCGGGRQQRARVCIGGNSVCPNTGGEESQLCNLNPCPTLPGINLDINRVLPPQFLYDLQKALLQVLLSPQILMKIFSTGSALSTLLAPSNGVKEGQLNDTLKFANEFIKFINLQQVMQALPNALGQFFGSLPLTTQQNLVQSAVSNSSVRL